MELTKAMEEVVKDHDLTSWFLFASDGKDLKMRGDISPQGLGEAIVALITKHPEVGTMIIEAMGYVPEVLEELEEQGKVRDESYPKDEGR